MLTVIWHFANFTRVETSDNVIWREIYRYTSLILVFHVSPDLSISLLTVTGSEETRKT